MAEDSTPIPPYVTEATTRAELRDFLQAPGAPVWRVDATQQEVVVLPADMTVSRPLLLDGDLVFLQPDGSVILIENAVGSEFTVSWNGARISGARLLELAVPEAAWEDLGDIPALPGPLVVGGNSALPGSGYQQQVDAGDPLLGLPYNPLLPPTFYLFLPERERDYLGADGGEAPPIVIEIVGAPILVETDATLSFRIADAVNIGIGPGGSQGDVDRITLEIAGLPAGTLASAGVLTEAADGTLTLNFSGSPGEFAALTLTFPTDFSTQSRDDFATGPLVMVFTASADNFDTATRSLPLIILPEGDAQIDDTLPDRVSDETDAPVAMVPSELLLPAATDLDGSEAIAWLRLTIAGLPAGITLAELGLALPAGATAAITTDPGTGAATLTITLTAADVGDVVAAYATLALSLPTDFSTANRNDLTNGETSLPLALTLEIQTDEDASVLIDTPRDGTVVATRVVDIGFEADITLTAPRLVTVAEDGGVPSSAIGVTAALGLSIAITDADGSETESTADPRFAARVTIRMAGLPDGATVNTGTLTGRNWTGSVAEARALEVTFPGDFNGVVLNLVTVTTPEGARSVLQGIRVTPTPDIDIDGAILLAETDAPLAILLSDFVSVLVSDPDEVPQSLSLTLPGLPPGTLALDADGNPVGEMNTAADGTLTWSLAYTAGVDSYALSGVRLILPKDFSTENPGSDLTAALTVTTDAGSATGQIPIIIEVEGDIDVPDTTLNLAETDAPVRFRPSESLLPRATDADSSESVIGVAFVLDDAPPGTRVSFDGGLSFSDAEASITFLGTRAQYRLLVIELPTDFSTANPPTELFAMVAAITDEGGFDIARLDIAVAFELDVDLSGPPLVRAVEDGDGIDGGGVTIDLGIQVAATDLDGSEDDTIVEIRFTGLVPGTTASTGVYTQASGLWTGTMAEANALTLHLPGDYSGTIRAEITAVSPEGRVSANQVIRVAPSGDVDLDVAPILRVETDAPLTVTPSSQWKVSVSDFDPGTPREVIDSITLALGTLPPGVIVGGVPSGTVSYIAATGGALTFTGTLAQYRALTLTFPKDFSTGSRTDAAPGPITGTLTATSNEDPAGQSTPVTLVIRPEGDAVIDDTLPDTVSDETDARTALVPSSLLLPAATDLDGSESIASLRLTISGLPAGITLAGLALTLPAGALGAVTADAATGAATLTITMTAATVGDVAAAYAALTMSLPRDFSTANRNDLTNGNTSLPLTLTLEIQTDEDASVLIDTARDGTVVATRVVDIGFEADITLSAPPLVTVAEDQGVPSSTSGVTAALGLTIAITDADGSETESTADPRFAAVVTISMSGLPPGATVNGGTLTGTSWTGSVAQARALEVTFPGDFNGTVLNLITVTTPEGARTALQGLRVTPTPDIDIEGAIVLTETDAPLEILLSDFVTVLVTDSDEVPRSLSLTLPGLPPGTVALDAGGNPVGQMNTAPDGTLTWSLTYAAGVDSYALAGVRLVLPKDYSTENPGTDLTADLTVTTNAGTATGQIPIVVQVEGDISVPDRILTLTETDAPLIFRPADRLLPVATDADGSENVTRTAFILEGLPDGTRVSFDGGASFADAGGAVRFDGTLAAYRQLVIRLPQDFSTQNPSTSLVATVGAITDEGGFDTGLLTITVAAEGDLAVTGPGAVALAENDAAGVVDEDATTTAPLQVRLRDLVSAAASDADGSESIAEVRVTLTGLPAGALYSLDGGATYAATSGTLSLTGLDRVTYEAIVIRLPADFSGSVTGSAYFVTDEALLAGETDLDGTDGVATIPLTITVASEADVRIDAADITVIEDLGLPIPLNLAATVTDVDGSESITSIRVAFSGLPAGATTLTDGTVLTGPDATWTGNAAQLAALEVLSFPQHFSGVIDISVTVRTNEGPAAVTDAMTLNVLPVAEPVITLSVDASEAGVSTTAQGFIVKEDASFLLTISAATPDRDGSERLTRLVIENMPAGWVPATGGAVDLSLFESGAGQIASASVSGTTLTIVLKAGVTVFDGALRVTPLANDDRDVSTITGGDLVATVTSVDSAAGLPNDTVTASDGVVVDVDAVLDPLSLTSGNQTVDENVSGVLVIDAGISTLALQDTDGSETITALVMTLSVATESDDYDPSDPADLLLSIDPALAAYVVITRTGSTADSVTYRIAPAAGASVAQVQDALESLQVTVPQHFSGVFTVDGTLSWNETQTGDVETDTSDNFATRTFQTVLTVRPIAEAVVTGAAFVLMPGEVAAKSPTRIEAEAKDGAITAGQILTLLESTDDGSGPGQVDLYVGIGAATPDFDGSEMMQQVTIANIPTEWVAGHVPNGVASRDIFFDATGTAPISDAEWAKLASAVYDPATGLMTLTFVPGVTSFDAAIRMRPTHYEDYDVDRSEGDPFTSEGDFFGSDLTITATVIDDNSAVTDGQDAAVTLDVDVDPVNNTAVILVLPEGNEKAIDDEGGVWHIPFSPRILDNDGSETITAVVMRNVPAHLTVYVENADDPAGPKVPALLTEIGTPPGYNSWSLEAGQWETVEFRGVPLHFAGELPITFEIVTTEADGGRTGVTVLNEVLWVQPVVDGGTPSESVATDEDVAVPLVIDGNIIDRTPESPEAVLDTIRISGIVPDAFGRMPRFFEGAPVPSPTTPDAYVNELFPDASGTLLLPPNQALSLFMLQGQDSNIDVSFTVELYYYETLDPSQNVIGSGTISVDLIGVADTPEVFAQDADPDADPDSTLTDAEINAIYRPDEVVGGLANHDRVYGYAGFDNTSFALDKRVTDAALISGVIDAATMFTAADTLGGAMTEQMFDGVFDGSETLYFIITGVPAGMSIIGGDPLNAEGESYIVTAAKIDDLRVVPPEVSEITYYDLQIHAVVVEDDGAVSDSAKGTTSENLAALDALKGGAVSSAEFTIIVFPQGGPGEHECPPEQMLPLPVLELVGSGDEDTAIELRIKITPEAPFYDSIDDLVTLPNGVEGGFTLAIHLPEGAEISSTVPGAVLFDPVNGTFVIDLAVLGVDPSDPTMTEGAILFTPPPHQSSPVNPFDPAETFGDADPYDALDSLTYSALLNNATCGVITEGGGNFALTINPVVDGPTITLLGDRSFPEDTEFFLDLLISGEDGGERPTGKVDFTVDPTEAKEIFLASRKAVERAELDDGRLRYSIDILDLRDLRILPAEHFSGTITLIITARSEDIDGSIGETTTAEELYVIPVADEPFFEPDTSVIDPDTGQPYIADNGTEVIVTIVEDMAFTLADVLDVDSPDMDGSETVTIVLSGVPEYLDVSGPSSGFVDNGDGSYTISRDAFASVTFKLSDEHARLPDSLDPDLPSEIRLTLSANTLELANSDENTGEVDLVIRVRPDADTPVLTFSATPTTGTEDAGDVFTLTLSGTTPDPHETLAFELTVPDGGRVFLNGAELPVSGGVVTIPGTAGGAGFVADGTVTFLAPPDFAGDVTLEAVAISTDADGIFTDTERSAPQQVALTIAVSPDLELDVLVPAVVLDETDAVVAYSPGADFAITVTDTDGSEVVDSVTYTIAGVPLGTTYQIGAGTPVAAIGTLTFTGTLAEFQQLQVTFPADFATNDTPLTGSITVTTNEGGNESGSFTIALNGELDLTVAVAPTPDTAPQTGTPLVVAFGIDAQVTDTQATPSEWLEEVVVSFATALPAGATASTGTISGDRTTLTLTRGSTSPAEFAALVAALSLTLPGSFSGALSGSVTVSTNHGAAGGENFSVAVNGQPVITGPVEVSSTDPVFEITYAELLANASDPDAPLSPGNFSTDDPNVTVTDLGDRVQVTVPDAYVGTPVLSYEVVDSGPGPAVSTATANLTIDTLQMEAAGSFTDPEGGTYDRMDDVTGAAGGTDIAKGTEGNDAVVLDGTTPYAGIEGFSMGGGSDYVDLSGSADPFLVDLGAGDDWAIGGAGEDTLTGGPGDDRLEGGGGDDSFVLTDLGSADEILDFEPPTGVIVQIPADLIDLTALVALTGTESLSDHVGYDAASGALSVDGSLAATVTAAGGGFADEVAVIFENAAGAQETAVV